MDSTRMKILKRVNAWEPGWEEKQEDGVKLAEVLGFDEDGLCVGARMGGSQKGGKRIGE